MIARILDWLMRDAVFDHGDTDLASSDVAWRRYRNGWISGSYMIQTNRGGGVIASCNGQVLNEGRMLDDVAAARAYCEGHAAGIQPAPCTPHSYDWQQMCFDPTAADPAHAFFWGSTPEGHDWWADNAVTPEGLARYDAMKRLYAADMGENGAPK